MLAGVVRPDPGAPVTAPRPGQDPSHHPQGVPVLGLIAVLLVVWVAVIVIGAVVKGLLWLAVIGAVLFLVTAGYGYVKRTAIR
jgi:hypothetical protein